MINISKSFQKMSKLFQWISFRETLTQLNGSGHEMTELPQHFSRQCDEGKYFPRSAINLNVQLRSVSGAKSPILQIFADGKVFPISLPNNVFHSRNCLEINLFTDHFNGGVRIVYKTLHFYFIHSCLQIRSIEFAPSLPITW